MHPSERDDDITATQHINTPSVADIKGFKYFQKKELVFNAFYCLCLILIVKVVQLVVEKSKQELKWRIYHFTLAAQQWKIRNPFQDVDSYLAFDCEGIDEAT